MVVDRQMDIFPGDPAGVALTRPVVRDAVTDPIETAQLLDVDVDALALSPNPSSIVLLPKPNFRAG